MEDPLAALRPLHVPAPVSWWPPAPGWWVVLILVLFLLVMIYRYWRRMAPQRTALRELTYLKNHAHSAEQSVAMLNLLLKRYAMVCWPASTVAALSGKAWLKFLDASGGAGKFSHGAGRILLTDPYRDQSGNMNELIVLARQWIKANRPGKDTDV